MAVVDAIAGVMIIAAVVWGFRRGLPSLGLAGFVVGAFLGSRLPLLSGGELRSAASLFVALPAALILGGFLAVIAAQLGQERRRGGRLDAVGGALLAGCLAAVGVAIAGPIAERVGALRAPVQESTLLTRLSALVAPSGSQLAENPTVAGGPATNSRPRPDEAPANARLEQAPGVLEAQRSVVKIFSQGCRGGGQGSGWLAADGIVVTNAHVVAAGKLIAVSLRGTGPALPSTAIWYDPINDIALLRVPGLRGTRPLPMVRRPLTATRGATLGFPRGKRTVRFARLGYAKSSAGFRARGRLPAGFRRTDGTRAVTIFRGRVRPGSSGGPLVDERGQVLTTVFATRLMVDSGFGVPNDFVREALSKAGPKVSTGPCRDAVMVP